MVKFLFRLEVQELESASMEPKIQWDCRNLMCLSHADRFKFVSEIDQND